jgi:hypothetical protein
MAKDTASRPGSILWHDLTVPDAEAIQRFYCEVVGWSSTSFEGDYNMMIPGEQAPVTGICHARGVNSKLPAQWLMYVSVKDLKKSVRAAKKGGGTLVDGPREAGGAKFCVIRDPAGAVVALYEGGTSA